MSSPVKVLGAILVVLVLLLGGLLIATQLGGGFAIGRDDLWDGWRR
jgi:hypothetical protein